jgi:hypothetical protein
MSPSGKKVRSATEDKAQVADEVTAPQSLWFTTEPEQPLQAPLLHPIGCLRLVASQKIKGSTDRYEYCSNLRPEAMNEFVLLGSAEAYPHHIRTTLSDSCS